MAPHKLKTVTVESSKSFYLKAEAAATTMHGAAGIAMLIILDDINILAAHVRKLDADIEWMQSYVARYVSNDEIEPLLRCAEAAEAEVERLKAHIVNLHAVARRIEGLPMGGEIPGAPAAEPNHPD